MTSGPRKTGNELPTLEDQLSPVLDSHTIRTAPLEEIAKMIGGEVHIVGRGGNTFSPAKVVISGTLTSSSVGDKASLAGKFAPPGEIKKQSSVDPALDILKARGFPVEYTTDVMIPPDSHEVVPPYMHATSYIRIREVVSLE